MEYVDEKHLFNFEFFFSERRQRSTGADVESAS